jgi:hypothetical protein
MSRYNIMDGSALCYRAVRAGNIEYGQEEDIIDIYDWIITYYYYGV